MPGSSACRIASHGEALKDLAPVAGSQFSFSEISATRIIASQKPGMATPSDAIRLTVLSTQPSGLIAAITPMGMPVTSASTRAIATISSVLGKARAIEVATFSPVSSDCERSPCIDDGRARRRIAPGTDGRGRRSCGSR